MTTENTERLSSYDPNSEKAIIGDDFSQKTLIEIQKYFPSAIHAKGLNPEYDIVIPEEEYGFPKIECKVCGAAADNKNNKYTKIPLSLFENSESKFVRIKYRNVFDEYSECYFKLSSMKKYFEKMKNKTKVIDENDRKIIMWPTHLLDGMYTKIKNTKELAKNLEKEKIIKEDNSIDKFFNLEEDGKNNKMS